MTNYSVDVMLQFPAMPMPVRVLVPIREMFFLDLRCERSIAPDGAVVYRLPRTVDGFSIMDGNSTTGRALVLQ